MYLSPTHWIVVLNRDGSSIYAAEGNASSKVRITKGEYTISGSKLYNSWSKTTYTIQTGYHYNFSSSPPTAANVYFTDLTCSDITTSDAYMSCTLHKSSSTTIRTVGLYLGTSSSSMSKLNSESVGSAANDKNNGTSFDIWYDLTDELGKTLKANTTYYYQFYAIDSAGTTYKSSTASFKTLPISSTAVSLSARSKKLYVGDSFTLTATMTPSNTTDSVSWSTSNSSVATVGSGKVTAVGAGSCTITAKTTSGKTASCSITVENPLGDISCNISPNTIFLGESVTVTWNSVTNADHYEICFDSLGALFEDGYITGTSYTFTPDTPGNYIVTVTAVNDYGSKTATTELSVVEIAKGYCGDNVMWEVNKNGTLTMSGTGATYNYDYTTDPVPFSLFADRITDVVIEEGITQIGDNMLADLDLITSLTIPDGVTHLGYGVASECDALTSVTFPPSLTEIKSYAFNHCPNLKDVHISDLAAWCSTDYWVDTPSYTIFHEAENLYLNGELVEGDLVIPDGVTQIGGEIFDDYKRLTSVTFPESVTSIGGYSFADTDLATIRFKGDAPEIGIYAFYNVTATAYYPADNETWTEDVMLDYGGDITWVAYVDVELPGDVNQDGEVNVVDIMRIKVLMAKETWTEAELAYGDLNGNGALDTSDIAAIKQIILAG